MRRRRWWMGLAIVGIAGIAGGWLIRTSPEAEAEFRFATVERGDLENTVSSTGTLEPVGTVEVGTQVSGTIARVYVDFNDRVRSGQMLAVLDTLLLKAAVLEAEANVARQEALLEEAERDRAQKQPLFERGVLSENEFLPVEFLVKTQAASLSSARAGLDRARANLGYAFIRSPIDGTVIHREVDEGQTVAASLSTPTLFVIAEDLSRMEIHAAVDESDIGMIAEGQNVRFEVPAHPDESFEGTVRQVRLQPTTLQNVVNYTVVVDAGNRDNLLLPGMTASIDFLVEERRDVLLVSNSALNLRPSEEMVTALRARGQDARAAQARPAGMGARADSGDRPADAAGIWYFDEQGELQMARVRTGATDGQLTEIVSTLDLAEGQQVIAGLGVGQEPISTDTQRPRMGGSMMGPPRRGPF